jgi:hypothetical protein
MARDYLTDEMVAEEVERLKDSEYVRLAQKEIRLKSKQRKWLYQLRWMEKRGRQLEAQGITLENIDKLIAAIPVDEDEE